MSEPAPSPPVVTVLIAARDAEGSIRRAVESVLEARAAPLECIVVDDGSSDATSAIVRELATVDPRVVLLTLDANAGVSVARNRGLALARGRWLTLLDADDRFLPGGLDTLIRAALGSDARAVVGQQVWVDGRRRWLTPTYDVPDIRRPGRKSLAGAPGLLNFVSPHAKLLRRDCWEGLSFEGRVLGDQAWVISALLRAGDGIEVIGDTVYEWSRPAPSRGGGSITATTRSDVERGLEAIGVAGAALATVGAEAERRLPAADADRLRRAYAARLLSMDLAAHLGTALTRSDPGLGRLLDAIRAFVSTVPAEHLRASDALARAIVELPLRRWWRVPGGARGAYWALFDAAIAIDPALPDRGASPAARLALRLAARGGAANRGVAALILMASRLASGAPRLVARALGRRR